jgi:hypothetical protein
MQRNIYPPDLQNIIAALEHQFGGCRDNIVRQIKIHPLHLKNIIAALQHQFS